MRRRSDGFRFATAVRRGHDGRRPGVALRRSLLIVAGALLAACGPPETDPNALLAPDGSPLYRDGTYAASYSHTGPDGRQPFLQIRVRAGLIDQVCLDAVDAAGNRLSDDARFDELTRLETGVSPVALARRLENALLDSQHLPLPADPRAVGWSSAFELLARTVTAAARVGLTVDAAGIEQLATPGPYFATDAPDELGWRAELVLVFDSDGVTAAAYREVRTELDGSTRLKRDDETYQQLYESASGVTSGGVASTLVAQLLESGRPGIDGVSGATLTTSRFVTLATRIFGERRSTPLPNRLCR